MYFLTPLCNADRFCCDFLEVGEEHFTSVAPVNGKLMAGLGVCSPHPSRMYNLENNFGPVFVSV